MRIVEDTNKHKLYKELDQYELEFLTNVQNMAVHIADKTNPHDVVAEQVTRNTTPGDVTVDLQAHTDSDDLHNHWTAQRSALFIGNLGTPGRVSLPNTYETRNEFLFIDGILKAVDSGGDTYDYEIRRYEGGATEIWIHDFNDVLSADSIIQVLYEERQ